MRTSIVVVHKRVHQDALTVRTSGNVPGVPRASISDLSFGRSGKIYLLRSLLTDLFPASSRDARRSHSSTHLSSSSGHLFRIPFIYLLLSIFSCLSLPTLLSVPLLR